MNCKPLLVGESNPYGSDPYYALYPHPQGSAGQRLCCKVLRLSRSYYLEAFERINLCDGRWSIREARAKADGVPQNRKKVLLGAKVSQAFGVPFTPFMISESLNALILPHPSGLCRIWGEPGAVDRAYAAAVDFMPEVFASLKSGTRVPLPSTREVAE